VPEQTAFTPKQFRWRNGNMTEAVYYEMMRQGRGPVTIRVGNVVLISAEEERNWQRRMSRPTGPEAARQKAERAQAQQRALHAARASAASANHVSKQRLKASASAEG
jgi:dephospho-CoA kinase